jgi:hypothetical protein
MQMKSIAALVPWKVGLADEPEMRVETGVDQRFAQTSDARLEPADAGVRIRSFEGQNVKLSVLWNPEPWPRSPHRHSFERFVALDEVSKQSRARN